MLLKLVKGEYGDVGDSFNKLINKGQWKVSHGKGQSVLDLWKTNYGLTLGPTQQKLVIQGLCRLSKGNKPALTEKHKTALTVAAVVILAVVIDKAVDALGNDGTKPKQGTIYEVPGDATPSGKPYIGRHNKPDPAKTRRSSDGRDRTKAEVVDAYDADDVKKGRVAEQKAIDERGGVENLDNKRNEIAPSRGRSNGS